MSDLDKYQESFPILEEGAEVAEFLQDHHREIGDQVTQLALAAENQSLLSRLFPTRLEKVFVDAKVQAATTELAFRHAALELSAKSKMEAVEEQCQNMIRTVKAHHRAQFARFVTTAYQDLQDDVFDKMKRHLESSKKRYELYEEYKELPTGKVFLKHIHSSEEDFFDWLESLMDYFRAITDE